MSSDEGDFTATSIYSICHNVLPLTVADYIFSSIGLAIYYCSEKSRHNLGTFLDVQINFTVDFTNVAELGHK